MTHTAVITKDIIDKAYSYEEFNALTESLLEEERTTNDDNSLSQLNYTKLNISRTQRWDKRGKLIEETLEAIESISHEQTWLVITEGWCGDSAQILPFVHKMAELSEHVNLRIILRDQFPDIIDEFLTDGKSRSIPKVVVLNSATLDVLGNWGPRPSEVQKAYLEEKMDESIGGKKAAENLHIWYARDKGVTTQREFSHFIRTLS